MKIKIIKRIFSIISIITILFTTIFMNFVSVQAVGVGDTANIVSIAQCDWHVKYLQNDGIYKYIITHYVGFYENGVFHPAYCLDKDKQGADENLSYNVSINSAINNDAIWRVLYHGFPYAGNLGLGNDSDAFFVTKQAIYSILDGRDVNRYQGADEQGNKMVAKLKELVNYGRNGSETSISPILNITTVKEASIDNLDSNYISQVYRVDSPINSKDIRIYINGNQAPEGSALTDMNNNPKTNFTKGEEFKVIVPRVNILDSVEIDLTATGNVETYPVFYSQAPSSSYQDYAIVTDPFVFTTTSSKFKYLEPKGNLKINKLSKEDNQYTHISAGTGLKNAIFEIERIDGKETYKKQFTTDEIGQINKELKLGKYKITEIQTPDYYVIGKEGASYEFTLKHDGQEIVLNVENDNVNLKIDVEKTGTTECKPGEEITYNFDIQNKSNDSVSNFIWGDKLPSEIRISKLITGTFSGNIDYDVQYITNYNTSWKTIKKCNTSESSEIALDSNSLGIPKTEYVEEIRFIFKNDVPKGFKNNGTQIFAIANDNLNNNQVFSNHTYVIADYLQTKLEDKDEFHTIVKKVNKVSLSGTLPRTGK